MGKQDWTQPQGELTDNQVLFSSNPRVRRHRQGGLLNNNATTTTDKAKTSCYVHRQLHFRHLSLCSCKCVGTQVNHHWLASLKGRGSPNLHAILPHPSRWRSFARCREGLKRNMVIKTGFSTSPRLRNSQCLGQPDLYDEVWGAAGLLSI